MVVEIQGYGRRENDGVSGGKWEDRKEMREKKYNNNNNNKTVYKIIKTKN